MLPAFYKRPSMSVSKKDIISRGRCSMNHFRGVLECERSKVPKSAVVLDL